MIYDKWHLSYTRLYDFVYVTKIACILHNMYTYICTRTVRVNDKEVDGGRPSGHSRRGLGSIRAVCREWRALKVFSARVGKTIPLVSFLPPCPVSTKC